MEIVGIVLLINLTFVLIFGVNYTSSCRTNQREAVMLKIKKIERCLNSCRVDDHILQAELSSELRYEEMIYSKINGWDNLSEIYEDNPRK